MRTACFVGLIVASSLRADDVKTLLNRSAALHDAGKYAEALQLAEEAIKVNSQNPAAYSLRGMLHFKLGNIRESLADFDEQIRLDPKAKDSHWRRGLTLYYAEKFADGAAQFVLSDRAEPEDVENAIWHFLCNARVVGLDKARSEFRKVSRDPRGDLMMAIYKLFRGEEKPQDILTLAETNTVTPQERHVQRFYAHYYVGMYYEAVGDKEKSLAHIQKAVEKYPVRHYMMDVAKVHLKLRKGK